ncbi:hypothetical protein SAMN05428988_2749 [Chitinophaga sp. YR573]|uniref:hypothetical protein n=1 Tax=Chitinophaga sp. YR573 TaxID=1881040 RepID=UPI0008CE5EA0|nr:hypothetical protein [Chitinophaga sp. YR573]SEW17594.1 hypothetical protein SAMN05428988_2749 [Chitinophaga sp. YR573]
MARWCGQKPPPFTGTKDGITVYRLKDDEQYYVRLQSSITGKRIKKDPAFKGFRNSSVRLRDASRIGSKIYRQLPVKKHTIYREITGKAILLLKAGEKEDVIITRLTREYLPVPKRTKTVKPVIKKNKPPKIVVLNRPYKTPSLSKIYRAAPG